MQTINAFESALEAHDYAAASRLCTTDFVFIGSGEGEECDNPGDLAPTMQSLIDTVGPRLVSWELRFSEPYKVSLHRNVAVVVRTGVGTLVMTDSQREARYRLTGVLRRTNDGWKWWLFHGSEAQCW
jgi:ketosteroid isomerase-like protein